ncbi:hypothetical protein HMPREF1981_00453 [Bacteroides pyogenes F0041]|uniref:Uncharacterized protein n=1 Tax=Bacteroides pyogenes F0041 TaxID=1321819 RepID=U2E3E8_9BACE|nr:hypothetical protein HMPREF1981_00453 [Bacteroides pyogenes F0041]
MKHRLFEGDFVVLRLSVRNVLVPIVVYSPFIMASNKFSY